MNKTHYLLLLLAIIAVSSVVAIGVWSNSSPSFNGNGIWRGNFDINGRGNFEFVSLYVDGKVVAHSPDARVSYRGSVSIDDDRYYSSMDMYLLTGSQFDKVSLNGTLDGSGKITAQFLTEGAKDKGTLTLHYDKAGYEKPTSLADIAGEWIIYEGFTITKFTIKEDGTIHGANTNGCGYDGVAKSLAPSYNAYQFDMFISSCNQLDGQFAGMGFLTTSIETNDTLVMQISNDGWGLYMPIVRDEKTARSKDTPT